MNYYGKPSKEVELEFKYMRKAAVTSNKLLRFIYLKIANYYENKQ